MQLARPSRRSLAAAGRRGWAVPILALVVLGAAAALGAAVTGAATAPVIADPGAAVRWGLPLVGAADDLAAAVTIGVLVLAGTVLPRGTVAPARAGRAAPRAYGPALRLVCGAGVVWALAALARLVLAYAAATGQTLQQPDLGTQLVSYVTQVEAGRWAAAAVVLAALVATVAAGAARLSTARLLAVPAFAALAAEVVATHAGSGGLSGPGPGGPRAVLVIGLHVTGVALWIGPLAGLLLLARTLADQAAPAAGYARLAAWASVLVAVSGALAAWQQLGGAGGVRTAYGALVAAKLLVLVLLAALAVRHRRRVLPAVADGDRAALARAAAVELVVAALAIGLSAALASTEPPASLGTALAAVRGPW
jgi:putative copper export protein